jgi:membrane protein insertase Oxa1/YidC/SpoIIIJ
MSNYVVNLILFIDSFVQNKALSIVLFSILVRLVLFPSYINQLKFVSVTKRLQPLVDDIKARVSDKSAADIKIAELYQEHKLNPLSGLLNMILQIVLMIYIFSVLRNPSFISDSDLIFGWKLLETDTTYFFPTLNTIFFILGNFRNLDKNIFFSIAFSVLMFFMSRSWFVVLHIYMISASALMLIQDLVARYFKLTE